MKAIADTLFVRIFHSQAPDSPYLVLWYCLIIFLASFILLNFAALFAGLASYVERRIAARMQSRIGPNLVGPQGILQWVADGLKMLLKEDLVPGDADQFLFRVAPYSVFAGLFGAFVALPFGYGIVAADLNVGVYYILAITSLVVVGIISGGWSSNSKWALFGALRSAAQIISYEIPTGLSLMIVVMLAGSLSTQTIIESQGGWPWDWFVFHSPFTLAGFTIFFISSLAEGNRVPFDLPEAESELVSGFNTEYSGLRFLIFPMAEWANLWVVGALVTLTYLGGWQIPGVGTEIIPSSLLYISAGIAVFFVKTLAVVFIVIQLRWTLPRVRVDQMTLICWTYLVPVALVCVMGTMAWMLLFPWDSLIGTVIRVFMSLVGVGILIWYLSRVRYNYISDKERFEKLKGAPAWYPPWKLP
ncbi:MAG: NADH-quinone oxidoreductase subunit NuoH [Thermodesulfobacteriota bacterium]